MSVTKYLLAICFATLLLHQCLTSEKCAGQETPGRLSREQREALVPGLNAEFTSIVSGDAHRDVRIDRFAAMFVGKGESPADFLPPGPFQAHYHGFLKLKLKGSFRFKIFGRGQITLKLNDQTVFDGVHGEFAEAQPVEVELVKGYNVIEIDYVSQPDGSGQFRVYWSSDEFVAEPLPSTLLFSPGDLADLVAAQRLRTGKQFVQSHLCLRCHGMPAEANKSQADADHSAEVGTLELGALLLADAPVWRDINERINPIWLKQWLLDPSKLRNDTKMPKLLAHLPAEQTNQAAADIAAFVMGSAVAKSESQPNRGESKRGEKLFEDRGCIACHRFTPVEQEDEYQRISLHFVSAKFVSGSLQSFLMNPREHYRTSRMPVPDLAAVEAADLEAFLRELSTGRIETSFPDGNMERGKQLASELGCFNCHPPDRQEKFELVRGAEIIGKGEPSGCLQIGNSRPQQPRPQYDFDDESRAAVVEFLKTDGAGLRQNNLAEYANRQFVNLRCGACHRRDDQDSSYFYVLQDESVHGLPPDAVPDLTNAGEKLLSDWMQVQIAGELSYRTRDHFRIRMPAFPDCARELALGIAAQHGFGPREERRPEFSKQLAEAGERIAAMEVGLGCGRCHAINEQKPIAPFDAYSTNLAYATERIRYEYYLRWMFNPQRVDPATRMLKFSPDLKSTGFASEFDGDAARQFEALWQYLQSLEHATNQKKVEK